MKCKLMSNKDKALLEIEGLCLSFGGIHAFNNISLAVMGNEIIAIIDPNSADKTCVLNCINGITLMAV